jgi:hypothetical protein
MRDRYEPHGPREEWPANGLDRQGNAPYDDFPTRLETPAGTARDDGLRRLSRLTWRTTQLSALAAATFAIVFARTAPAHTTSSQAPAKPAAPTSSATATATPSPSASASKKARTVASTSRPTPAQAPAQPAAAPAPATAAPPRPTLAPPTTAPAPAQAPSPVQSTSSGSHTG